MPVRIICFTGTRADYGILRPALLALQKDSRFDLRMVATGMHLLDEYGNTIGEIKKDGLPIIATPSILMRGDATDAMSKAVGLGILYFSEILSFQRPDFVLLLGDRGEMLAAAVAAHYQNIGIIHVHGGEYSGSADDAIRHAISKLAHIHFVATRQSGQNLVNMGEADWRIAAIGSLRKQQISRIKQMDPSARKLLCEKYQLDTPRKKLLVVIHPDSKEPVSYAKQISSVRQALEAFSTVDFFIIGPNSDSGGDLFRRQLIDFSQNRPHSHYFSSIPDDEFLFLLDNMDLFVGNSSSGILEAPFFHLPFLSVGNRQNRREQADNVIGVPYDENSIRTEVERLLQTPRTPVRFNPYDLSDHPELELVNRLHHFVQHPAILQK